MAVRSKTGTALMQHVPGKLRVSRKLRKGQGR